MHRQHPLRPTLLDAQQQPVPIRVIGQDEAAVVVLAPRVLLHPPGGEAAAIRPEALHPRRAARARRRQDQLPREVYCRAAARTAVPVGSIFTPALR